MPSPRKGRKKTQLSSSGSESQHSSYRDSSGAYGEDTDTDSERGDKSRDSLDSGDCHNSSTSTLQVDVENDVSPKVVRRTKPIPVKGARRSPRHHGSPSALDDLSPERDVRSKGSGRHLDLDESEDGEKLVGANRTIAYSYTSTVTSGVSQTRNRKPSYTEPEPWYNNVKNICVSCVVIVLVLLAVFVLNPLRQPGEEPQGVRNLVLENFEREIEKLTEHFPAQSKRFWSVLKAATKRIIKDDDPIQPAAILISAPEGVHQTGDCLAKRFASIVTKSFESASEIEIFGDQFYSQSSDDTKLSMDDALKGGFGYGSRAAIIYQLQRIKGNAAMLLHAYCDNENAPFRKAVIVMTLHMEAKEGVKERGVEEYLANKWKADLDVDQASALFSRIANNIALVTPERDETLKQYC